MEKYKSTLLLITGIIAAFLSGYSLWWLLLPFVGILLCYLHDYFSER